MVIKKYNKTFKKCFVKLHAEYLSLKCAPQLGNPVEVDSKQIKTLIENNQ